MTDVYGDFETYSEVDITTAGGYAYAHDDSTNPICFTWAIDDEPVELWTPRDPAPERLLNAVSNGAQFYAHNMKFDRRIWNTIMVRDFGWPFIDIDNCTDSMALCATYGLPLGLGAAGEAMGIKMQKAATGKALIKLLCSPKKGGQPHYTDPNYHSKFREMFAYGIRDTEAMRELVGCLPKNRLIPQEHEIWKLTYNMNEAGLPIAYEEVIAIRDYLTKYVTEKSKIIPGLVDNAFQKITQTIKIKEWCHAQGYLIPDTTAATVILALEDPACPANVKEVLALRQELGKSSVAKYLKLEAQAVPDKTGQYWIYDNLEFHGAGPGRWTGRGFQMHNLPRAKVKDPEAVIQQFMLNEPVYDPVGKGKALIRPMIRVPKDHKLFVLDYDSIENKVLHWLADDQDALVDFRDGVDQYITMASARYKVPYGEIKAGREAEDPVYKAMRQMGKVIILGAGFGMGKDTFVTTAKDQFGMTVSEEEADEAIKAYRLKYHLVKKLWNDLKVAAVRAVLSGKRQTVRKITFGLGVSKGRRWLAMKLPSGKCVYYCDPKVEQRFIPKFEQMGKVPTITHYGRSPKTGQWTRMPLIPGRITENAVQGTAREVMAQGLLNVQERMSEMTLVGTVHDEGLGLVHERDITDDTMAKFNHLLCDIPWAKDCPITASGYVGNRYKKD